jgi:phosphatidylglycerophosphatase A
VQWFALGFGSGLLPKAPGTWGSVAALVLFLLFVPVLPAATALLILLMSLACGGFICGRAAEQLGVHDHGAIVWDEFVGQWMVLAVLPWLWSGSYWLGVALAFVLFRVFDIKKPWPIAALDARLETGWGIMLDDILAAAYAIAVLAGLGLLL